MGFSFSLRPATEADQRTIVAIIHQAQINPRDLNWPNFIVAESDGQVVGVGQVKQHRDGSRELASIAVSPEFQKQGVGDAICRALIERESGTLYLMCENKNETYYNRFGFGRIGPKEMPPYFRRISRLVGAFTTVSLGRIRLCVMKRDGT